MFSIRIAAALAVMTPFAAHASQGPGAGAGTASAVAQHLVAGSIALVGLGLLAVALIRCASGRVSPR